MGQNGTVTSQRWRIALWSLMLLTVFFLMWEARGALLPFAFGAIIAYALAPLVDALAHVLPASSHRGDVWRRGVSVLLVYLVFIGALVTAGMALIPIAADQVRQFIETLPEIIDDAVAQVSTWLEQYRESVPDDVQIRIDNFVDDGAVTVADALTAMMRRTFNLLTGTIATVLSFVIVPFWMFYAMRDRHFVRRNLVAAAPESLRTDFENVLHIADRLLGRYIRGQLLLGVIVAISVGVGLTLMGVQLSLALAIFAGITELIPLIGPWIGAIPALAIVAATDPGLFLWVALLYLVVQQVENILLVPRIQGGAVAIHPGMIILLLAVGAAAFGFLGLVIIVPLAAILRELFWYADRRFRGETPEDALAATQVGALTPEPETDEPTEQEAGPAADESIEAVAGSGAGPGATD